MPPIQQLRDAVFGSRSRPTNEPCSAYIVAVTGLACLYCTLPSESMTVVRFTNASCATSDTMMPEAFSIAGIEMLPCRKDAMTVEHVESKRAAA